MVSSLDYDPRASMANPRENWLRKKTWTLLDPAAVICKNQYINVILCRNDIHYTMKRYHVWHRAMFKLK